MAIIKDIKGTTQSGFTLNAGASQSGANWQTILQVPSTGQSANLTFTLPPNYGTSGQVLQTNGSGDLSWTTVSGSGGVSEELSITHALIFG